MIKEGNLLLLDNKSETTLSAILTIFVLGHEDTSSARRVGALAAKTGDLSVLADIIVEEGSHLDLLLIVGLHLGLGEVLLLPLLGSSYETKNQVEGRFLLNVVVRESTTILELLTSEDQTLLIRGNTLFVLDLLLDSLDGVRGFD